jgi:hypothetical protein
VKLVAFRDLLKTICPNVQHFKAKGKGFPRIVYAETGRKYYCADNRVEHAAWQVGVSLFTKTEFEPMVEELEALFNDHNIPFDLAGVEYGSILGDAKEPGQDGVIFYLFECEV